MNKEKDLPATRGLQFVDAKGRACKCFAVTFGSVGIIESLGLMYRFPHTHVGSLPSASQCGQPTIGVPWEDMGILKRTFGCFMTHV